jgi:tryptophan-rich sensory protein
MNQTSVWLLVLAVLFLAGIILLAVYLPSNYLQLQRPMHPTMIPSEEPGQH